MDGWGRWEWEEVGWVGEVGVGEVGWVGEVGVGEAGWVLTHCELRGSRGRIQLQLGVLY